MATTTAAAASSEINDGPVLTLINKRIRNLRKKLNRITQLEQAKSAIKNKEQEDLLKSKPAIVAAVDELEKFRQPLSVAVDEEISLAIQQRNVVENKNEVENVTENVTVTEKVTEDVPVPVSVTVTELNDEIVEDLLSLIYFGSMFDVKSRSDFDSIMLTRTHERNCCLTYDYVTDDDANVMLGESDLDLISSMGSLLISRPVNSSFSHQNALQRCVEHAKLWLAKSDQTIDSNSTVTYAALREKLVKIIGSDYLKITPEMKATADVAAEAAGNYTFQVENSVTQHEQKEDDVSDFQRNETHEDQSVPVEDHSKQHDAEGENFIETPVQMDPVETQAGGQDYKEQYVPRRSYQNQRGGGGGSGRNGGGAGGGRRGGFGNGRGGRSGGRGGPYQNGRNQYSDQSGNYYPRNYNGGRGRGGRGNGNGGNGSGYAFNNNASGVEVAES